MIGNPGPAETAAIPNRNENTVRFTVSDTKRRVTQKRMPRNGAYTPLLLVCGAAGTQRHSLTAHLRHGRNVEPLLIIRAEKDRRFRKNQRSCFHQSELISAFGLCVIPARSNDQALHSPMPSGLPSLKLRAFSSVTAAIACRASRVKNA